VVVVTVSGGAVLVGDGAEVVVVSTAWLDDGVGGPASLHPADTLSNPISRRRRTVR